VIPNRLNLLNQNLKTSLVKDLLANHSTVTTEYNYGRTTNLFTNSTRATLAKSKELALYFFSYFNLENLSTIESILERAKVVDSKSYSLTKEDSSEDSSREEEEEEEDSSKEEEELLLDSKLTIPLVISFN